MTLLPPSPVPGNPPAELPVELQTSYSLECCVCQASLSVAPSLSMIHGTNSGHGTCPWCRTFLHLELATGGERMQSERWKDYAARTMEAKATYA